MTDDMCVRRVYDIPSRDLASILRVGSEKRPKYYWGDLERWRVDVSTLPGYQEVSALVDAGPN